MTCLLDMIISQIYSILSLSSNHRPLIRFLILDRVILYVIFSSSSFILCHPFFCFSSRRFYIALAMLQPVPPRSCLCPSLTSGASASIWRANAACRNSALRLVAPREFQCRSLSPSNLIMSPSYWSPTEATSSMLWIGGGIRVARDSVFSSVCFKFFAEPSNMMPIRSLILKFDW